MKIRGFETVSRVEGQEVTLPTRSTKRSAGYDFIAFEDVTIPPMSFVGSVTEITEDPNIAKQIPITQFIHRPIMVKTGIKAYMQEDEFLELANRSSNPGKKGLVLSNGVGIVDSDYYNNEENEGEIAFPFYNLSNESIVIKKGEKIGQGVFRKYLEADEDASNTLDNTRSGGFGSTGK